MSNIIRVGGGGADLSVVTAGATDLLAGKVIVDSNGNPLTGTMPSKVAQTYTPGTTNQIISAGQYLSGTQTILGDADLTAANIKQGVDIFGVAGALVPEAANYETGTSTTLGVGTASISVTVSRTPKLFVLCTNSNSASSHFGAVHIYDIRAGVITLFRSSGSHDTWDMDSTQFPSTTGSVSGNTITLTYNDGGYTTFNAAASRPCYWYCLEA